MEITLGTPEDLLEDAGQSSANIPPEGPTPLPMLMAQVIQEFDSMELPIVQAGERKIKVMTRENLHEALNKVLLTEMTKEIPNAR